MEERVRLQKLFKGWLDNPSRITETLKELREPEDGSDIRSIQSTCRVLITELILLPLSTDYNGSRQSIRAHLLHTLTMHGQAVKCYQKQMPRCAAWQYELDVLAAVRAFFVMDSTDERTTSPEHLSE